MKDKKTREQIQAELSTTPILGTYEGECADADITNLNGLDITRPVWTNVFESEDYKQAIKLGWYIGFLGHPADADCNDFKDACIVMTEGHIDDNGKVYGKFNLIDTPVGRIVKTFQDAGVTFGISVRGAGDVDDNSVDPDTFVFRGFDLVTFPAYPDSIPKFTEVAASTDLEKRKKYQAVCAAIKANAADINDVNAIKAFQQQFAAQSEEYAILEARKKELEDESEPDTTADMLKQQVTCMTTLFLEEQAKVGRLRRQVTAVKGALNQAHVDADRKIQTIQRIMTAQMRDAQRDAKQQIAAAQEQCAATIAAAQSKQTVERRDAIVAARQTNRDIASLESQVSQYKSQNLKFSQEISAAQRTIDEQAATIQELRRNLRKTVVQASTANAERKASNRDERKMRAIQASLEKFQRAYAELYARASGVDISGIQITASTTLEELQSIIASASGPQVPIMASIGEADFTDLGDENTLITV
ncbi:hypothetical protein [uncultured Duncaniella sp.]|uniref:hypothetical protein n=1 Tax=uncultured Duncaniella sp. TaxID=2768039 RepID=UPI0026121383|nr:hypothetical protein [uncultured Duncaniella sp.]